jgi:DNA-binding response OmpR family regulator
MSQLPLRTGATVCHPSPSVRPTVLVVDDDIVVRQACAVLLEDEGFDVVMATDGVEGLLKFRQIAPDVVLTDIVMPNKEGIELIIEMRREHPGARIVAMTGGGSWGTSNFLILAKKLGANIALPKPFDDLELINAIRGLLDLAPTTPAQGPSGE